MTVFSLRCQRCGAAIDLQGRYGFKLKTAGVESTTCLRCRQSEFLKVRRDEPGLNSRRILPLTAVVVVFGMVMGGLWVTRQSVERGGQDAALPTAAESPSR